MYECVYFGYVVERGHVKPDPEKIRSVEQYPVNMTKKEVRASQVTTEDSLLNMLR